MYILAPIHHRTIRSNSKAITNQCETYSTRDRFGKTWGFPQLGLPGATCLLVSQKLSVRVGQRCPSSQLARGGAPPQTLRKANVRMRKRERERDRERRRDSPLVRATLELSSALSLSTEGTYIIRPWSSIPNDRLAVPRWIIETFSPSFYRLSILVGGCVAF